MALSAHTRLRSSRSRIANRRARSAYGSSWSTCPPPRIDAHGGTESQPILPTQENSGRALRLEKKSGGSVSSVAVSPDGSSLISGSEPPINFVPGNRETMLKMLDAVSGALLYEVLEQNTPIWSIAVSPVGSRIASGGKDHKVRIWDSAT